MYRNTGESELKLFPVPYRHLQVISFFLVGIYRNEDVFYESSQQEVFMSALEFKKGSK